jgi:hypothetical protein
MYSAWTLDLTRDLQLSWLFVYSLDPAALFAVGYLILSIIAMITGPLTPPLPVL